MKRQYIGKWLLLILMTLQLSGCGFALRQPQTMAPALQNMYLNTPTPNDPFVQTLKRVLIANNIHVVDTPKDATASLNLLSIRTTNTMTSGGGVITSGFYNAYLTVLFSLTNAKGQYFIQPNQLQQSQSFTSNATQVLSGNLTAAQLSSQMEQSIAQMIVNQLAKVPSDETQS